MSVKLLSEHHLKFQSLKGGCIGSSESTLVKMPHCWKSHVMAHMLIYFRYHMPLTTNLRYFQIAMRTFEILKYLLS